MVKIEAITLEEAYSQAAKKLQCSVTELNVEVVQYPTNGLFGLFRKKAIIVASIEEKEDKLQKSQVQEEQILQKQTDEIVKEQEDGEGSSFVTQQEEVVQKELEIATDTIAKEVEEELQALFQTMCFTLDEIKVSVYDETTLYIEINGEDAALLIGKEGYRYKALSYMLFNWINAKYNLQIRLEIAEFLQNQEEAVHRYLESVKESVDRDGRAQTKILDGVLIQIALKELRATYPQKYVAIRSTKDGLKYIIINDYNY